MLATMISKNGLTVIVIGLFCFQVKIGDVHCFSSNSSCACSTSHIDTQSGDYVDQVVDQFLGQNNPQNCHNSPYRSLDGSCNNLYYPKLGMPKTRYSRLLHPKYTDFIQPRNRRGLPNPRTISMNLFGERSIEDSKYTLANMQFGQFIAHDMSRAVPKGTTQNCCEGNPNPPCYSIKLPSNDPIRASKECLHFARSQTEQDVDGIPQKSHQHNEQISHVTSYLDLSTIYGNSQNECNTLREFRDGRMALESRNGDYWLPRSGNASVECDPTESNEICYKLGDSRDNFTPSLAVVHTLFLREHNRIANELATLNPHYSDEVLFQEARRINIAQYQHIVYNEWLPILVGRSESIRLSRGGEYSDQYDPEVNPSVLNEHATAALRYCHNQIPGKYLLISSRGSVRNSFRLSDISRHPGIIEQENYFLGLVRGLVTQGQKRTDSNLDPEIKYYFNRKQAEFGIDLRAFDIQRSRDHGLGSYNDAREFCGLRRATSWEGFLDNISPAHLNILKSLYNNHEDVDLSVGGSLEAHVRGTLMGPVFRCISTEQFFRTKAGDRFFYDRSDSVTGFSKAQLKEIRKINFSKILCRNTKDLDRIQRNGFIVPHNRNNLQDCATLPTVDLRFWRTKESAEYASSRSEPFGTSRSVEECDCYNSLT